MWELHLQSQIAVWWDIKVSFSKFTEVSYSLQLKLLVSQSYCCGGSIRRSWWPGWEFRHPTTGSFCNTVLVSKKVAGCLNAAQRHDRPSSVGGCQNLDPQSAWRYPIGGIIDITSPSRTSATAHECNSLHSLTIANKLKQTLWPLFSRARLVPW